MLFAGNMITKDLPPAPDSAAVDFWISNSPADLKVFCVSVGLKSDIASVSFDNFKIELSLAKLSPKNKQ